MTQLLRNAFVAVLGLLQPFSQPGVRAAEDEQLAFTILKKADQIRFPNEGFQVDVSISSASPNEAADVRKYRILSKGNENTIVMVTEPAAERGQIMLMKGRDLWLFLPNVSQPVRIPLSQRLTGQVANGDLARANPVEAALGEEPRRSAQQRRSGAARLGFDALERGVEVERGTAADGQGQSSIN